MDKWILYKHTTPSGKIYVGITKRKKARDRWKYGHGYSHNKYFYRAIVKYGWNNITHDIVADNLTEEEACAMEKELIALYRSKGICYNIAEGGQHGNTMKRTLKEKEHLKMVATEYFKSHKHPFRDKHHSEEAKAKMREKRKKYFENTENRKNLSTKHCKEVIVITPDNKTFLFSSGRAAAIFIGTSRTTTYRHIKEGKLLNGYFLMYKEYTKFK